MRMSSLLENVGKVRRKNGGRTCELDSSSPESKDERSSQEKSGSKTVSDFVDYVNQEALHTSREGIENSRGEAVSKD